MTEDEAGTTATKLDPVQSTEIGLSDVRLLRSIEVWLFEDNGEWIDRYVENGWRPSWGKGVLSGSAGVAPVIRAALDEIRSGESNVVEFKEFVQIGKSDPKSYELIATTVAFGNADGGRLYIGVNDKGEIIGCTAGLRKNYGSSSHGSVEAMKASYLGDVKKLITEGVHPRIEIGFEWITAEDLDILVVRVSKGTDRPYSSIVRSEIFLRRGATSRIAQRADLDLIYSSHARAHPQSSLMPRTVPRFRRS